MLLSEFRLLGPSDFRSALGDSAGGAGSCTGTALDAGVRVDFELSISCRDSAYGALSFASSAANASITNYICHDEILL